MPGYVTDEQRRGAGCIGPHAHELLRHDTRGSEALVRVAPAVSRLTAGGLTCKTYGIPVFLMVAPVSVTWKN